MKKIIIKSSAAKIVIPAGQKVLLLDNIGQPAPATPANRNLQIIIGRGCEIQYVFIERATRPSVSIEQRELFLGANSRLKSYRVYLGQGTSQLKFISHLDQGAELDSRVFFYQSGTEILTAEDNYIFEAPDSRGRFNVTGLLSGAASAQYYSDIIITPVAQKTDSRIDMKLYLLDPRARGVILPGLKIAANEVKAGHGASTFQLSPDDLFYLQARGLSKEQAKNLVINSLAQRFVDGLVDQELKKDILTQIANKETDQSIKSARP